MLNFTLNSDRCTRCRLCVSDCPSRIIEQTGEDIPFIRRESEEGCIACQHCLAICPTAAVSIFGRNPDESLPLSEDSFPNFEKMLALVRGRRSVRQYKDENVDPTLLKTILRAVANCPTAVNQRKLTFTVIDDKEVMKRFQREVMTALTKAAADNRIPARAGYLLHAVNWKYEYGVRLLFRTAPHALIVSTPPDAHCPHEDVALALAEFDLLAQSAGLGTVWWGMLSMTLAAVPELKKLIGLPADHHFFGMLFGIPAIQYARTVQRDDPAVIKTVEI